jgi:hypothetical protein
MVGKLAPACNTNAIDSLGDMTIPPEDHGIMLLVIVLVWQFSGSFTARNG